MREAVVAVFATDAQADTAVQALENANVPRSSIRRYHKDVTAPTTAVGTASTAPAEPRDERRGFWSWLMGEEGHTSEWRDPTYDDRFDALYATRIEAGNHVVAVYVDHTDVQRVMDVITMHNPLSVEEESTERDTFASGTSAVAAASGTTAATAGAGSVNLSMGEQKEEVIPLAEEQVNVGKTRIEEPVRIRRYVVERPVEKTVTLQDERVEIERRAPTQTTPEGTQFEERVVEVREAHEVPVVSREARVAEEVVVRHEVTERQETVRDTVRKEEVEVDRSGTTNTKSGGTGKRRR